MDTDPNNVLQESVHEVFKCAAYEILDFVRVQLDPQFSKFENTFFVELLNHKKFVEF